MVCARCGGMGDCVAHTHEGEICGKCLQKEIDNRNKQAIKSIVIEVLKEFKLIKETHVEKGFIGWFDDAYKKWLEDDKADTLTFIADIANHVDKIKELVE